MSLLNVQVECIDVVTGDVNIPLTAERLGGDSGAVIISGESSKLGVLSTE